MLLEAKGSVLCLYNAEKQLLAQHIISEERGCTISCESHRKRDTSVRQEQTYREVQRLLGPGKGEHYLELLKANKSRYYYSNLKVMMRSLADVPVDVVARALDTCLENSIYNGHEFTQVLFSYLREDGQPLLMPTGAPKGRKNVFPTAEMTPAISNISFYESILE